MSIGLAIAKISEYTGALERVAGMIADEEGRAMKAAEGKDAEGHKEITRRLSILKTLHGMLKDFLDFWKQVIQTTLTILKMTGELAQGGR